MKQKEGKRAWSRKGVESVLAFSGCKTDPFIIEEITTRRLWLYSQFLKVDTMSLYTLFFFFLREHLFTLKIQESRFGSVYFSCIYIKSRLIESYKQKCETFAQEVLHFFTSCTGFRDVASAKMNSTPCKQPVCSLNTEQISSDGGNITAFANETSIIFPLIYRWSYIYLKIWIFKKKKDFTFKINVWVWA